MSHFIYVQSEPGLWTVGSGDPSREGIRSGKWNPVKDFDSLEAAAEHTAFLNGNHSFSAMLAGQSVELREALVAKNQEISALQDRIETLEETNSMLIRSLMRAKAYIELYSETGNNPDYEDICAVLAKARGLV